MGGHGGLNILPQKRWNVYRFDNREKVRKDEEEAAKEEQLKREQSRKRDAEFRIEQLRAAKGLAPLDQPTEPSKEEQTDSEPKSGHINLFEGIKIFDPIKVLENDASAEKDGVKRKKMKKEEVKVVAPEDEKYRLGYGIAGKGVKLPWYLNKPGNDAQNGGDDDSSRGAKEGAKKNGKKTLEELRDERMRREKREREREHALMLDKRGRDRGVVKDRGFSMRR